MSYFSVAQCYPYSISYMEVLENPECRAKVNDQPPAVFVLDLNLASLDSFPTARVLWHCCTRLAQCMAYQRCLFGIPI